MEDLEKEGHTAIAQSTREHMEHLKAGFAQKAEARKSDEKPTETLPADQSAVADHHAQSGESSVSQDASDPSEIPKSSEPDPTGDPVTDGQPEYDSWWDKSLLAIEIPKRARGGQDWPKYAEYLCTYIGGARTRPGSRSSVRTTAAG
jgi:hypothetical protein